MTLHAIAPVSAFSDLAAAGYRPAPMLPGADGAAGWTCADGRRVEFHEHFAAQALDHMPPDATAEPGIVVDGDVIAIRTLGGAESYLPPTPLRFQSGDSVVSIYRAGDDLSAAFGFDLPPRSFGWQDDNDALFVIERAQAVSVPGDVVVVPAVDLPKLTAEALQEAHKAMGAPKPTCEGFHPLAEAIAAEAAQRWAATIAEGWQELRSESPKGKDIPGRTERAPLVPHDIAERRAELEAAERAEKAADFAAFVAQIEADEAAAEAVEADDEGQGTDAPAPAAPTSTAPAPDPYAGLYDVPGLVGDITRWIVATSHRPLPLHALGAALVAIGTAAGRKYKGPTFSGTHLYIAALAVTGAGKDHPGAALLSILEAAGMGEHTGASSFKSASSIISLIARSPLTAMKIDEFGAFLKKMNDVKGGSHLTEMSGELRGLWGSSFKVYKTPEWAGMASKTIHAPAVSIFGTTTPTDFYEGLRGADATNGFLNRFLVLDVAGRPAMQEPTADPSEVPTHIAEAMASIYASGGNLGAVSRNDPGKPQDIVNVPWGEGAKAIYDDALRHAERIADQNPARGDYYSRSAEMALRMATIVGIGCDPVAPVVTAEAMQWAIRVVAIATKALFENADALIADNVAQANYKMVKAIIRKAKGAISRSALTKAVDGRLPPRVMDDIMGALIEAGDVAVVPGEKAPNGKVPLSYRITAQGA